jgi:2-polyprenyl-3-methyl-5-hydroxy-6-metoxy-1,4-benzoquinol methylase
MITSLTFRAYLTLGIYIFLFSLDGVEAQVPHSLTDTLTQQQFIAGCAAYRETVIQDIDDVLQEFVSLSNGLAQTSLNPEAHYQLKEIVLKGTLLEEHEDKSSKSKVFTKLGMNDFTSLGYYEHWFKENAYSLMELQFLVHNNILDSKSPYKLADLKDMWREFSFYGLKANIVVADIGAGNGVISFIMLGTGLPLQVIATEIDEDFITMLKTKIFKYSSRNPASSISLVKAGEKELGLQDQKLDRVILREVYHHLKNPEPILEDIRLHLAMEGVLILKESTKDIQDKTEGRCQKAITYKKIIKDLDEAGFELVGQEIIEDSYLLRFVPSQ